MPPRVSKAGLRRAHSQAAQLRLTDRIHIRPTALMQGPPSAASFTATVPSAPPIAPLDHLALAPRRPMSLVFGLKMTAPARSIRSPLATPVKNGVTVVAP